MWGMHTRVSLAADLEALDVEVGDVLFVHSSFKSLGPVEGGAAAVIGALEDAVGSDGLILMPSFNLLKGGLAVRAAAWNRETSPSMTGYLTEFFRTLPGTVRSDHFSHSVAARGRGAAEFVAGHKGATGMRSPWDFPGYGCNFGDESPFLRAYHHPRGRVLMLGVTYESSTFCHLVEVMYWNERLRERPEDKYLWLDRDKLGEYWEEHGHLCRGRVGDADSRLFGIREFVDTLLGAVRVQPDRFRKQGS